MKICIVGSGPKKPKTTFTRKDRVIAALFGGAGTDVAAQMIMHTPRVYRIDLSMVINKYIGETEKNLRKIFDAAESGGAILFFDEGEALFGKRAEINDGHERYADIEVGYLLRGTGLNRDPTILMTTLRIHATGYLDESRGMRKIRRIRKRRAKRKSYYDNARIKKSG